MAMNLRNYGIAEGRLVDDPKFFKNNDGSQKVKVKIGARNNYKEKDGSYGTQFVSFDGFVRKDANGTGVYGSMHKGDLVAIRYEVRNNNYQDKDGNMVYDQVLLIQEVDLKESKSTTEARASKREQEAAAGSPVAEPAAATDEDKPFQA